MAQLLIEAGADIDASDLAPQMAFVVTLHDSRFCLMALGNKVLINPPFQITEGLFDRIQKFITRVVIFEKRVNGLKAFPLLQCRVQFLKIVKPRGRFCHSGITSSKFSSSPSPARHLSWHLRIVFAVRSSQRPGFPKRALGLGSGP
ncbi:hypothetical protein ACLIR7_05705 [Nitratireductor aquimarinus]|uniref:hypothetical protein n=1 Tax=Nitratireductor aquimarinus TaxID=889300 RepID=UPI00398EB15F